ncbi:MAG: CHRD domain-containing protein, partial [Microcystaceae cyanobacterium]
MLRTTITADKLPVYLSSLAAGVLLSTLPQLEAQALNINFTGTLEGSQEVPPVMTPATGFATGNLMGDFGSNNFVFTYEITYSDLTAPIAPIGVTGGHLHNAPFGDTGSISHILDTDFFNYTGTQAGTIMGDWRFDDSNRP